jgi:3-oxoacyl-[acyl-carrier protein] reductase
MDFGLEGRKALVGGASKGLGLAAAKALASEGCDVAIVSRSEENLREAIRQFGPGQKVIAIPADLSTADGVRTCIAKVGEWGPIDVLVNNTGGPPAGRSFELDEAAWMKGYESILLYTKRMCDHFVPSMRERKWGRVITITSYAVKEPIEHLVLSNVFRTGVTAYLKVLAKEVAADGVTVNSVLPGAYRTARYEQLLENTAKRSGKDKETVAQELIGRLPQRRFQKPGELGALVAFLASEQASGITGAAVPADGGMLQSLLS